MQGDLRARYFEGRYMRLRLIRGQANYDKSLHLEVTTFDIPWVLLMA